MSQQRIQIMEHGSGYQQNLELHDPGLKEEFKLEENFSQLAVNQPKSSKHEQYQPVGGSTNSQNGCNLGKNIPVLHKVQLGKEQQKKHQEKFQHNNEFAGQGRVNSHQNDESGSSCSSGNMSQSFSSGIGNGAQHPGMSNVPASMNVQ